MVDLYRRSGSETPVNTTFTGVQSAPAITSLANGNYVIVWRDDNTTDARGQVFSSTGGKVGGEFLLHSPATGTELAPKVAALSDGGFVAVWSDTLGDAGSVTTGIHGQRFDATGAAVGTEFQANTVTVDGAQSNPNVAGLTSGRFVVTWTDPASSNEIKAAIFAADGTPEVAEIAVTAASAAQNNSTVTTLADGSFVIAWYNGSGISARAYSSAGVPEGAAFTVNTAFASAQAQASITALASGGFVVTWTDQTQNGFPVGNEIRARIYDADGLPDGNDFVVNTRTLGNQMTPSVSALVTGGFVVVWDDASGQEGETNDNGSRGIKAQVFDADGSREGAEFLVNTTVAQNQVTPVVTGLTGGGFAVSWQDFGGLDGNGAGIVTQAYEPFDTPITDLVASTTTLSETPIQNNPVATLSGVGAVNASFTYTLIGDSTGGAFEVRGNQLFAANILLLDFETAPSPQVTIRVTDENGHSYDETLTLTLTDAAIERPMGASDDILVNTATVGGQIQAEIATLGDGGFIVVWTDQSADSGSIKAQRFDADGNKVGVEFKVNTTDGAVGTTSALQTGANVAGLQDGGFVVTWTHFVASGSESAQELRGQFYNADGSARGAEFLIGQPVNGSSTLSVIAVTDNGDVVISWRSGTLNTPSGQGDVMARIYAPDGTDVKATFAIANPTGNQGEQTIAATDDGGFVVAWRDDASPGTIKMRFFDSAYDPRGAGDIVVNAQTADIQTTPVIAKLSNGNIVVTWSTQVRDPALNYNVHHRIFDANGTAITGELDSNIAPNPTIQNDSRVVALDNGEFAIFWTDNSSTGPANMIGQRFGADGLRIGDPFIATQEVLYSQSSSGVTSLGGDSFAYIWSDLSGIGGDDNGGSLKVRIFDSVSNAAPTLADVDSTLAVSEGDAPARIDADVTFGDADDNFDGGSVTVSGVLADDVVAIRNFGNGAGEIGVSGTDLTYGGAVIGSFTGGAGASLVVTLNGAATAAAIEALLENLTYANNSDTPTASRNLQVEVEDDAGASTFATITVNVTAVNDTPVATVPANGAITGYEGTAIELTGLQVADIDGGNAVMTVNLIMSQGSIHVSDSVPGGVTSVSGNDQNMVVVSFDGTLAQINATLSAPGAVTLNAGPDYSGPVTVQLLISDNGATGLDPGGPLPNAEYDVKPFIVNVLPVNDAPVLDLDPVAAGVDATASLIVGNGSITLAPGAAFTDDNTSFDGATLTVSVAGADTSGDQLQINSVGTGAGQIAVTGGTISYEGTDVGSFTGGANGAILVVTFNADASHDAIQAVMDNVSFAVADGMPATDVRTISFELVDGGDTANGGADTATAQVVVDVTTQPSAVILAPDGVADGSAQQVNTTTDDIQRESSVAALVDGGYVVAWQSYAQDGSGWGVYFQRYDAAGAAQGSETQVNTFTGDQQISTAVAALTGGGFVVTWTSNGQDGSLGGIYAQRFDAAGDPLGSETRVNSGTSGDQSWSSVAALSDGGYVVSWQSSDTDGYGIYSQRYDAAGVAQGGETQVNTTEAGSQNASSVAALAGGGYVVTWQSMDQDGDGYGVFARLFDGAGGALTGEMQVNTETAGSQSAPSVAALVSGGYVVTWQSADQDGDGTGIYAQRYDAAGAAVGGETLVNTTTADDQAVPAVAALAGGGYVVTWRSDNGDGSFTVYSQTYDKSGTAVGGETSVDVTADFTTPAAAGLTDGGHVVTWHEPFQDGSGDGVYAQLFDDAYQAVEQVPLDLKGTVHVADPGVTGDVTVVLSVTYGELHIEAGTSGVDVVEVFPDEWELTGTPAEIEALLNTDGTSVVNYTYNDDYPPPSDALTITIDDGTVTSSDSAPITIVAVNDAPVVDLDFFAPGDDAVATWTEGDGPQLLAPDAQFDDDNDSHDGATLTITINGATAGDQLTIDSVGTDLGELSISGSDVLYEGQIVGSWSGGVNGAPLVITFNDDACYCSIGLSMASILYENTDALNAASARTVDFTFVDGGDTANGGDDTTTSSVDLLVLPFAEVIAGPDATGNEDAPIALTGVVIDGVAGDPTSDVIIVNLGVSDGTLDIRTDVAGGVAAGDVVGNGTATLVLTGTQDAINATLSASNGLTYQGAPDFFGSDELSIAAAGIVNSGTFGFSPIGGLPIPFPIARLDMIDLDGDGTSDMVFGVQDALIVYGSAVGFLPLNDPGIPTGFAFADYDGDGEADIAFAAAGPTGYIAFASSDTGDVVKVGDLAGTFDIVTGDFNGDGLADLAATDSINGRVALFLQDAPGSFEPVAYTTAGSGRVGFLAVGDFNGDSHLDLLASSSAVLAGTPPGSVDLLLGNGDGTFQAPTEVLSTPAAPGEVVVADFDGDGALDFAYASNNNGGAGTNGVVVALGNGDGTFGTPVGYDTTADGGPTQLVAADFDGDGLLDLAVANVNDPGTFSILVGNGDGSFQAPIDFDTSYPAFAIAFGDPDGDGDMDLITGSLGVGGGIEFFNNDLNRALRNVSNTKDITIGAVNDAPTQAGLAGDGVSWTEGGASVTLDGNLDATIADIDSADFDTGSLTVAITAGGVAAEDVLAIVDQGPGPGQIGLSGADVTYGGVTIGTVSGGTAGAALVVAFNADATAAAAQALARAITYSNVGSDSPTAGDRTIGWTLIDGDGVANGGQDTLQFASQVTVVAVNDAPTSTGLAADSVTWIQDHPPALLDNGGDATIADLDSADFDGGHLSVQITGGLAALEDILVIASQGTGPGQIDVSGSNVSYGGTVIGTTNGGGGSGTALTVTFNANATPQAVEALARAIAFDNAGIDPTVGARTVSWTLVDGDGTANGGVDTHSFTTSVSVISAEPALDLNGADPGTSTMLAYTEGGARSAIAPDATMTDPDTVDFSGGVLTVAFTANGHADDSLGVSDSFGGGNVSLSETDLLYGGTWIGSAVGGSGGVPLVITFGSGVTASMVEEVMRAVGYVNFGANPGALTRTVTFTLADGDGHASEPVTATVEVTPTPDGVLVNDDVFYTGDAMLLAGSLFADNGLGDDYDLGGGALQITAINGGPVTFGTPITLASGALLTVNADGTFVYDPSGGFASLVPVESGATNYDAGDTFSYTVNGSVTATATVKISGNLSAGDIYEGSIFADSITSSAGSDYFDLGQGGDDVAHGLGGDDSFYFGSEFTAGDTVDGGAGTNDQIGLEGNYTGANALVLGPTTISNVEVIALLPGFDYDLTTVDANVAAGGALKVFAGNLGADDDFTFDGSAETDGKFMVYAGLGIDQVKTGAGDDGIYFGPGKFNPANDRVDGGTGTNDQLALDGHYTLTLDGTAIQNIDVIALLRGATGDLATYDLTVANSLVGAGQTMTLWGTPVETAMTIDGSGELDGALRIYGGSAGDTLIGSNGDDWFWGGLGADALTGGAGADTFMYDRVGESRADLSPGGGYDTITGFDDAADKIDLAGFTVTGFAGPLSGALDAVTMDSMLEIAFTGLAAHQAAVFTATGGDLAGTTFLLIDANGTTGYQASGDFLIAFAAPVSPIDNLGMFI